MARYPKPAEGTWTEHYPHLGTEPVSYEDSISPEFYELERDAIFSRFVPESGLATFETMHWMFDLKRATHVDARAVAREAAPGRDLRVD